MVTTSSLTIHIFFLMNIYCYWAFKSPFVNRIVTQRMRKHTYPRTFGSINAWQRKFFTQILIFYCCYFLRQSDLKVELNRVYISKQYLAAGCLYVNLTLARVIWKEETLIEKTSPLYWLAGKPGCIFLIDDCCGKVQFIAGAVPFLGWWFCVL